MPGLTLSLSVNFWTFQDGGLILTPPINFLPRLEATALGYVSKAWNSGRKMGYENQRGLYWRGGT